MNIKQIKKIYPYIKSQNKNIKWRSLKAKEFICAIKEKQKTCNCFLNSTFTALYNSMRGKEILSKRIKIEQSSFADPAYKIILSPNGKNENYRVSNQDYFEQYFNIYRTYNEYPKKSGHFLDSPSNNLNTAIDIAVSKMIKKHPEQKPWYMRLYSFPNNMRHEFNKPSRAFEWFTGIKPIKIGEDGIKTELIKYKDDVLNLLNYLGKLSPNDYSFVLMSGGKETPQTEKWHCVPITKIDNTTQQVYFFDKRLKRELFVNFDTILNSFKAIVGINWINQDKQNHP